jgi:hypothetical protein
MKKHDAFMFAAYLVIIALGVEMMNRQPMLGMAQVLVGAGAFGLRAYFLSNRARRS